jgi:hypothetical protein
MSWTKREIVEEAYAELALAGYVFDIQPEELQRGLRRLDTMLATWEAKGIRIGYRGSSSQADSDLDQDSGLPDMAVETVYCNLAIRLGAGLGKQVRPETRFAAAQGYDTLLWRAAEPQSQQMPNTLPIGAGSRLASGTRRPFFPTPDESPVQTGDNGDLNFLE